MKRTELLFAKSLCNTKRQMSNRLKHVAVIVVAAAIAGPPIAAAQSPAHCLQEMKSATLPLQTVPEGCPSIKSSAASRRIVLLLVQGGTIGITSSVSQTAVVQVQAGISRSMEQ
jgi:hypothetical protein